MFKQKIYIPGFWALFVIVFFICSSASAQDDEGFIPKLWRKLTKKNIPLPQAPAASTEDPVAKMTKEEIIAFIRDELDSYEEVLPYISGLKCSAGKDGKKSYTYFVNGRDTLLEQLDRATLENLLDSVQVQIGAYQSNLVAEQIRVIQDNQRALAAQQQNRR